MKRILMVLMVQFVLISGCAPVKDATEVARETSQSATMTKAPPTPVETATVTETPPSPVETANATEEPPAPTETATPTEQQPTPITPFTAESIRPGQQQAYSFDSSSGEEIIFWLYLPDEYDENRTWPLILSLHGFLGFEPSLEKVRGQNPLAWVDPGVEFPFILISPQAPNGPWAKFHEPMDELIEFLGESISIDPQAQFLTGLSAGAVGAWQWALALPDRFTGVAPIAGGYSFNRNDPIPENICLLKDLPVWAAHSEGDREAPIESTQAVITALEACGSTVAQFTVYSDLNHVDSISAAYTGPELYDWMLTLME